MERDLVAAFHEEDGLARLGAVHRFEPQIRIGGQLVDGAGDLQRAGAELCEVRSGTVDLESELLGERLRVDAVRSRNT